MLRARSAVQPVGPVRKNAVRQLKKTRRRVNGVLIGSMRNNVKRASRKRIQQLIDEQTDRDTISMKGQVHDEIIQKVPGKDWYILFHVPTPKCVIRIPLEDKNTIYFKLPYHTPNLFAQVTPPLSSRHAYAPITQDEDEAPTKGNHQDVPRRSQGLQEQALMIISPRAPASISPQALYSYFSNAVFDTPEWPIPNNLVNEELPTTPQIDIEEYANGVVRPVTKETITKYKTLMRIEF